jgi:hypothetical protein
MLEEILVSGAEIVQPGLTIGRLHKSMLGTFSVARKTDRTFATHSG